ncbi:MAG: hypothetical protein CBB81_04835 [Cellvibrionales bacterium TMED21]|nr:glycerol acyltransferase [Halieaceae bacterium]OUT66077.1 MAG: hypothetical protein CBB81_04835 [Cellvibrionales bacterium TMED21]
MVGLTNPTALRWLPGIALWWARRLLRREVAHVNSIYDFQMLVKPRLDRISGETSTFTVAGLEGLPADQCHVFISNHRDIVMDSAYANHALNNEGRKTLQIAIGDNLLQKPWVSDLMRINKSFIVKRNLSGPKQLLAASKQLASYIREMITGNSDPIWIAQREGRAKDGNDVTDPAILKMLSLSRQKGVETPEAVLRLLNIVPLTISYELDPCDTRKAKELAFGVGYEKDAFEDLDSIATGIMGQKGQVHLQFGAPPAEEELSIEAMVERIDAAMVTNYRLFETNTWAWEILNGQTLTGDVMIHKGSIDRGDFLARFDGLSDAERDYALAMYAQPVSRRLAYQEAG